MRLCLFSQVALAVAACCAVLPACADEPAGLNRSDASATVGGAAEAEARGEKPKLHVGTFDSRAVAIAYAGSEAHERRIRQMIDEHKKAKAAGDEQKVKQLEAEGQSGQERLHMQGFSTGSVANILEQIKEQLPVIAKEAGVDVIVSKWDIAYQAPSAQFVDVTELIVKPFHPEKRRRPGWIKELEKHAPIPLEDAKKIKD